MTADQTNIVEQAIAWHLRLAEADERAWGDFVTWLEVSPAHADAYGRVAANDRLLEHVEFPAIAPVEHADNDNVASPRRWWLAGGSIAVAAALSAVLLPGLLPSGAALQTIATANGERRTVSLADGTSIELSGGTLIRIDGKDSRTAMLDSGEAVFHVKHDASRPFTVTAGGVTVRDVGTVFDVSAGQDHVRVAVAEGSVLFRPDREAITLGAGDALLLHKSSGAIKQSRVAADMVGGWRSGSLSFEGARISDVAASLTRLYGAEVELESGLSERPFTGMVRFTGAADRDVPHLAELIGAGSRRAGNRWILSPKP